MGWRSDVDETGKRAGECLSHGRGQNPTSAVLTEQFSRGLEAAAPVLGMQLDVLHASTDRDLDTVFAAWGQPRADALVISSVNFFSSRSKQYTPSVHDRCP